MRTSILLLVAPLVACRPRVVLEPVYDCTRMTSEQKVDMRALFDECGGVWECERRAMQLYCDEVTYENTR